MEARDVLVLLAMVVLARVFFAYALVNSASRHARYRMRARLARWLMDGRLHDVRVTKGKVALAKGSVSLRRKRDRRAAERRQILSVVRRPDSGATGTEPR